MISVCIATFNGAYFIQEQLTSVLSQLGSDDEVLIADDGSIDNTKAIVDGIADARIRWVAIGGNLGVIKNFERVLSAASGDYIFLCDQDDVWLPEKVSSCIDALEKHLMVVTDCIVVDSDLNVINPSFFAMRRSDKGLLKNLWKNCYLGCCMAFHRELLLVALPIPKDVPMHDMWLGILADFCGDVIFLPKKLSLYRRHISATSPTAGKSNFGVLKMTRFRLNLLLSLLGRVKQKKLSIKMMQRK